MLTINFSNNLIKFIFYALLSEHSRTNIANALTYFPLTIALRKDLRYRKRGVYQREITLFYRLDRLSNPTTVFRFGKMKNPIRQDNVKNRQIISQIFSDYPNKVVRERIY
ncbi:hypothetical protein FHQ26_09355 [Testudinibacter sp. TR-2022]|uniref:hypothetical protein n=1 Tax=Testudinibacter sp. TR-2022 TaxID=2585029 RepID=UPI00111A03DF|nr:hypothetical protein [Testudinibacter sp. TR-2022]TNH03514.1 hypothetical protein FHQ22_08140 [Pasteurellaceae bacterium Phil31]TNH07914.1 hypothetical protein FHQ26_09355 [Testudinibacter sp. TR-2022]TNH10349.1 hypothetical protein FHQ25_05660 [Testudinibacter sp. TR-2022]TNH14497.1 hypothetical protein FIA56_04735 [Testudinibacter sp. TR-2022]TNH20835.1 hypothetical protein FHQ23_00355 [Testudinibacter sp. TR-2022]